MFTPSMKWMKRISPAGSRRAMPSRLGSGLLAGALSLAGCNQLRPPIQPQGDPYDSAQVHVATYDLRRDTAAGPLTATRDEFGLLHVTLPIRSIIDKQLYVDYRITWFGDNRQVLEQTSWATKTLPPNTPDRLTFTSLTSEARDFQIDLRYPELR